VTRFARSAEVIAHRGASGYAPEHTFAAYDLALAQGADALELDVRPAADGELVVLHDPTLLRTAADPRAIAEMPAADLDALDPAVRPATFAAVLDRYGTSTQWLVDLKDPHPKWETHVGAALTRHGLDDRAVVQSFDADGLARIRAACPALVVSPLYRQAPTDAELAHASSFAVGVGVRHSAVDVEFVTRASRRGLSVRAWTANDPQVISRLVAAGVDGIITDVPDVARRIVDAGAVATAG
jgi:glycerophosphoryl diester phosphodiesterase